MRVTIDLEREIVIIPDNFFSPVTIKIPTVFCFTYIIS